MGHRPRILTAFWVVGCALLLAGEAAAQNSQMTVFVSDDANATERVVLGAEGNAGRIFRQAGVDIAWVNCGAKSRHQSQPGCGVSTALSPTLLVRIIPRAHTLGDDIFGVSFLDHNAGTYADLFFEPIKQLHEQNKNIPVSSILGSVLAHEMGHLLLGWNAHSPLGIMQPRWNKEQLQLIAMGRMFFSNEQAAKMHGRIAVMHQDRNSPSFEAAITEDRLAPRIAQSGASSRLTFIQPRGVHD